jgi:hypothetical protein
MVAHSGFLTVARRISRSPGDGNMQIREEEKRNEDQMS